MGFWETVLTPHRVRAELQRKGMLQAEDWYKQKRADRAQGLLGSQVTTEGEMRSAERFTPQGQPIYDRATLQPPRTEYTGFLGGRRGPGEMAQLRQNYIDAGYNVPESAAITNPIIDEQMSEQKYLQQQAKPPSPKEMLSMESSMMDRFQKQITAPRTSMKVYNQAANLYDKAEFKEGALSGADSIAMAKMYLKQILPNESVMSTDVGDLRFSQGVPEYISSWLNNIFGSGSMSKDAAEELIMTMNKNATFEDQYRNDLRKQFGEQADRYGVSSEFMGSPYEINPLPFYREQGQQVPYSPNSNLTPQQQSRRAYLEELEKQEKMQNFPDRWK